MFRKSHVYHQEDYIVHAASYGPSGSLPGKMLA